jgi:threonylcarbamoyladenosine tRNA methylthiotransferase MtaB
MNFAGGHVFTYSARPGTPAAHMNPQVRFEIRKERNAVMRAVLEGTARSYRSGFVGRTLSVLWESTDQLSDNGWQLEGLTDNYLRVLAFAPEPRWNQFDQVSLTAEGLDGLEGEIL